MSTKHDGLPVQGYKPQSSENVALVNRAKILEERVLRYLDELRAMPHVDQRMVSLALTGIQDSFMWANRAVFQPARATLPEDLTE